MNVLFITKAQQNKSDIDSFLQTNRVEFDMTDDQLIGIQKAHQSKFDVVVMDAELNNDQIDKAIRIFKNCNPNVRIIVRTDINSRELEILVRKEHIFYYHLNSFGNQEFQSALSSALELNKTH